MTFVVADTRQGLGQKADWDPGRDRVPMCGTLAVLRWKWLISANFETQVEISLGWSPREITLCTLCTRQAQWLSVSWFLYASHEAAGRRQTRWGLNPIQLKITHIWVTCMFDRLTTLNHTIHWYWSITIWEKTMCKQRYNNSRLAHARHCCIWWSLEVSVSVARQSGVGRRCEHTPTANLHKSCRNLDPGGVTGFDFYCDRS